MSKEEEIDFLINQLFENRIKTQLTSIKLIQMMNEDDSLKGYSLFYASTLEEILNNENNTLSYDEKEQFIILHSSLIKTYKELINGN